MPALATVPLVFEPPAPLAAALPEPLAAVLPEPLAAVLRLVVAVPPKLRATPHHFEMQGSTHVRHLAVSGSTHRCWGRKNQEVENR